jgi:hypothetical protein
MSSQVVSKERTGWRDEGISNHHRTWGFDCPAVDLDFVLVEYHHAHPKALIEYRQEYGSHKTNTASYRALISLANLARIPIFNTIYSSGFTWYKVGPLNDIAKTKLNNITEMNELQYVSFLYHLRGQVLPDDVREQIEQPHRDK